MNNSTNVRKCFKVESNISSVNTLIRGYGCSIIGDSNACLIATEKILAGTKIFAEKAMLTCNLHTGKGIEEAKHILKSNNFCKQKAELNSINPSLDVISASSSINVNISENDFSSKKSMNATRRLKILLKQCGMKIKTNGDHLVFQLYSITRHSCVPNVQMTLYGDNLMVAHALKDIPRGHELTHSRIALNLTHIERQHLYINKFQKPCYCWHCHFCESDAKFCESDDNYRSIISSLSKNLMLSDHEDETEEELQKRILHLLNLTTVCEVGYMDKDYNCYSDITLLKCTHLTLSKLYLKSGDESSSMKHLRLAHGYSLLASGQNSKETEALSTVISNHNEQHIPLSEMPVFYSDNKKENTAANDEKILKRKNLLLEKSWRNQESKQIDSNRKLDFSVELPVISRPPSYKNDTGVDFQKSLDEFGLDESDISLKSGSIIDMDEEMKKFGSPSKKAESLQLVPFIPKPVMLEAPIGSPKSTWTSLVAEKKRNHWSPPKASSRWARSPQKKSSPDKYTLIGANLALVATDSAFKSPNSNDYKNNNHQEYEKYCPSLDIDESKLALPKLSPTKKVDNNVNFFVDIPKSRDQGPSNIRLDYDERGGDVHTTTSIDLGGDEESIKINK